ncbi:MAG: hypothetical protein KatS3mg076_0787 [Candidatus Binatia bacterium]|nr:MAG: hypothetical protein KatS3mg076_0787 [Candidatus Binatia bacterium]
MPELTRRQVLKLFALLGATATPLRGHASSSSSSRGFLSGTERAVLEAAASRIVPSDSLPGAREARAVDYIQGLLSFWPEGDADCDGRRGASDFVAVLRFLGATEPSCPGTDVDGNGLVESGDLELRVFSHFSARPIFAGGPFSDRNPFPDAERLAPSDRFPENAFLRWAPLSRVQKLAWRARLFGTEAVPEIQGNPLADAKGGVPGGVPVALRRRYREGVAAIEAESLARFGRSFVELAPDEQDEVLAAPGLSGFVPLLTGHVLEGMFSAPEYGGNANGVGWKLLGYGGDSQPLGYTLGFDEGRGEYVERPERPNSRRDPDDPCAPFSPRVEEFLRKLMTVVELGQEFPSPECIEV